MAMTTEQRTKIIKIVVGMFGAAPGATYLSELSAYAGKPAQLVQDLTATGAFASLYPNFLTNEEFATNFINNLLGKTVTDADAKKWAINWMKNGLDAGASRGKMIFEAIKALDAVDSTNTTWSAAAKQFDNKVAVAEHYSVTMGAQVTDLTTLQSVIASVTDTTDVSTPENIKQIIKETPGVTTGQTFTLTANIDNIVGTSGNDTIIGGAGSSGAASTLGSADVINGGAGTDTLKLTTEGAAAVTVTPNLTSVEKVEIQALSTAGSTVNMVNATGVKEIWNVRSTDALTVTNVQEAATVGLRGDIGTNNYIVGFRDALAAGTNDSVKIALDGATAAVLGVGGVTAGLEFETLNIDATGANTIGGLFETNGTTPLAATKAINVSGTGSLDVLARVAGTVTSIDASANSGGVGFDLAATGAVSVKGSTGDDTFMMGNTLTTADVLVGNGGNDTLGVTTGASLVTGLQVTGFSILDIGGADNQTGANAYDMSKLPGITTLEVGSTLNTTAGAQTTTINNLAKGAGIEINAAVGNAAADKLEINVKDAGAGSPNDSISVLVSGDTAINTTGVIDINDIETVTVKADKAGAVGAVTHTIANLTADEALTIKVANGDAGLTISDLNAKALVLFDASEATQAVSVTTLTGTTYAATNGVAFKLGAGADTLNLTGSSTTGGDFWITGGAGGDKITLTATGTEVEHLVYTAATDSQSGLTAAGANKFDTITNFDAGTGTSSVDLIDLKVFGFTGTQAAAFAKSVTVTATGGVAAADATSFFVNAGQKAAVAVVASGTDTWVFVDANKDGNYDASADMAIKLAGVTSTTVNTGDFVFA